MNCVCSITLFYKFTLQHYVKFIHYKTLKRKRLLVTLHEKFNVYTEFTKSSNELNIKRTLMLVDVPLHLLNGLESIEAYNKQLYVFKHKNIHYLNSTKIFIIIFFRRQFKHKVINIFPHNLSFKY